jgi:hypothetical protein
VSASSRVDGVCVCVGGGTAAAAAPLDPCTRTSCCCWTSAGAHQRQQGWGWGAGREGGGGQKCECECRQQGGWGVFLGGGAAAPAPLDPCTRTSGCYWTSAGAEGVRRGHRKVGRNSRSVSVCTSSNITVEGEVTCAVKELTSASPLSDVSLQLALQVLTCVLCLATLL